MNRTLGGYRVDDIEIVACFDIAAEKVGRSLAEALAAKPNNTLKFAEPEGGVRVERGRTVDGFGRYLLDGVEESPAEPVDVARRLVETGARVVISYLPVGSEAASAFYAEEAIAAGCAYVNCVPVFLASNARWRARFADARLPLLGDDVKSQVGATILHRSLVQMLADRGANLQRTYQLNVGGNADFRNMLERDRLMSKKASKTGAVTSLVEGALAPGAVHIGPSDYVPWLEDQKVAFIRLECVGFGGAPIEMEVRLKVWDSPNSAAVVCDAVRYAQIALDRGVYGAIEGPSAVLMKSPPHAMSDAEALAAARLFATDGAA